VLAAMFPGGTITGAPKIRTMEIIEELEPVRRGIYTGSLGFISWADDVIFNILIRTLVAKDGMAYVQAGAGVVTDSDAAREYEESLSKAKALWVTKESPVFRRTWTRHPGISQRRDYACGNRSVATRSSRHLTGSLYTE